MAETLSRDSVSPVRKYQDLAVGSRSLARLLVHEMLVTLVAPVPGALGLVLRRSLYGLLFDGVGRGTVVGANVTMRCPGRIALGASVVVDDCAALDAKGDASRIRLGDRVLVGRGAILSCAGASIEIGDDVSLGPYCYLRAGLCPVSIGSSVTIGAHSAIVSGSPGHERSDIPMRRQIGSLKGIRIGNDVWLGVGVRVIDGVSIGSGAVVGAGAVVVEDVPDRAIVAGVPARPLGARVREG